MHSMLSRAQSNLVPSLRTRLLAGLIHLLISLLLACASAALVFLVWFPGDFKEMAGGRELVLLMVSVDVTLGPLLTIAIFNRRKGWPVLRRDLAVLVALQLGALAYGLHASAGARPIALVFEVDRFKVVIANDVLDRELPQAQPSYQTLPWTGPWTLAARPSRPNETVESLDLAIQGYDLAQRPSYWRPYDPSRPMVLKRARPFAELLRHYSASDQDLQRRLSQMRVELQGARFLPVTSRRAANWIAVIGPNGDVAGFAPYDGFF